MGSIEAAPEEIRNARVVAELLGSDLFNGRIGQMPPFPLVNFIKEAINITADGNAARLAKRLGVSKSILCYWMHGKNLPAFPHLVNMAIKFNCQIADILVGNSTVLVNGISDPAPHQMHYSTSRKRSAHPRMLRCEIEQIITETPSTNLLSLSEIGRRLNINYSTIRKIYPDLAQSVVQRYRALQVERSNHKHQTRPVLFLETARQLMSEGLRPTRRRMAERLKGLAGIFSAEEKRACTEACRKAIEESVLLSVD